MNHFGAPPADSVLISISLNPQQMALVNGHVWREGVCVWTSDTQVNAIVPPACLYTAVFERQFFLQQIWAHEHTDVAAELDQCPRICNNRAMFERAAGRLGATVNRCLRSDSPLASEQGARAVQCEVLGLLVPVALEALREPPRRAQSMRAQARTVHEARQFVLDNLGRTIRVSQLCDALGMSRRQLQASFTDVLGMGPLAYMRILRLNKARELIRAGHAASVRDAALRCGFRHLGRFSEAYRDLFAESPSCCAARRAAAIRNRR